jgi:hypothetical protein
MGCYIVLSGALPIHEGLQLTREDQPFPEALIYFVVNWIILLPSDILSGCMGII